MQKRGGEEEEEEEDESCRQILFLASPVWYEVLPSAPVPLRGFIRVLPTGALSAKISCSCLGDDDDGGGDGGGGDGGAILRPSRVKLL